MSIKSKAKRGIEIYKKTGLLTTIKKGAKYFYARFISLIGGALYSVNSQKYWDFRMKYDWDFVGGGEQTSYFAAGMFANLCNSFDPNKISTIIDYGCATGDSAIFLKIFFQNSNIALYDISDLGVEKALLKYGRFIPVDRHKEGDKYNLVYSSNVIEHVENPKEFVNKLINLSNKYVVIQCPYKEMHPKNEKLISPENKSDEHIWTINEEFIKNYIEDERVEWELKTGIVPMAWQGGVQAFIVGKLK